MNTLGAVLAGGLGSRMGADKAAVEVDGLTMLDRVSSALLTVAARAVVLGEDRPGYECWPDALEVSGPLAGIATALSRTESDHVLVIAVDHAFVRLRRSLGSMESRPVPRRSGQPRRSSPGDLRPLPEGDRPIAVEEGAGSIQTFAERVAFEPVTPEVWGTWGEDGRSWFSVDTPEALREGTARFL